MFASAGLQVAGMGEMDADMKQSGMPAFWNSYVTVEDTDATAARCQDLGGSVRMPTMELRAQGELIGTMAILCDPEGAAFSLWKPGQHRGADLVNEPNAFCWNELATRDMAAAQRFYADLLGWTFDRAEGDTEYWEIRQGKRLNGGMLPWQAEWGDTPAHWSVYFSVADCDATVEQLKRLGGQLLAGPTDIAPGRFAVVQDPGGAVFQVMYVHEPE